MASLPAVLAGDLYTDNPCLVVTVEMGLVYGVVVSMPDSKLAQDNKHGIFTLYILDVDPFQLAKSLYSILSTQRTRK